MRLRRLSLDRFGHFTDRRFDFGPAGGGTDFHIIYGPNEAGKTTTMEAILRLFYGFPLRDGYAFKHPRSNLQVSATLEIDGAPRDFTRLPSRSGSLVDQTGTVLPEAALASHLAGLSQEDYRRLLCLDDETIERGGEEIANAEGDIGRLLFSAAAGVADLSTVLDGARAEADAIWKQNGRKHRIAELKRDLAQIDRDIRDHDVTAAAWKSLKRDLGKAQREEAEARRARDDLTKAKAKAEARRRSLPLMAEIRDLEEAIAPWTHYPDQLGFSPEALIELRGQRDHAVQNIARLTDERVTLDDDRAGRSVDMAQLNLSAALDALTDLAARDRTAQLDLDRRLDEVSMAEDAMAQAARELGVTAMGAGLMPLVVSSADIARLEDRREDLRKTVAAVATEAGEVADLADRVTMARDAVADLGPAEAAGPSLADILLRHDADSLSSRHAAALQAVAAAGVKARRALANLSFAGVTFDQLPVCPSSVQQAASWADRHQELRRDLSAMEQKRDDHVADVAARRAQARGLTTGSGIVSDAEAEAVRTARDAMWAEHLAALDTETAARFHAAMQAQDRSADTRLAQSRDLAQLREIEQAATEAQVRADEADKRLARLREESNGIEAEVSAAAAQIGLPAQMTPAEWQDWVDRHARAQEEARTLRDTEDQHAPALNAAKALLARIAEVLPETPPDLARALPLARRMAEEERRQAETRQKADDLLRQARRDLARREVRLAAATKARSEAGAAWAGLVRDLVGDAVAPDRLEATLEPLRQLREHDATRAAAERRVATMRADQAQFDQEVTALAREHGIALLATAADTFAALRVLSDKARSDREEVERIKRRIGEIDADVADLTHRKDAIDHQAAAMAAEFPDPESLRDIDALREAALRAEKLIESRAMLAKLTRQVLSDLGAADIEAARKRLEDTTLAALDAAIESNAADLALADEALTRAIHNRARAEQELAGVTGDDSVARLAERKATLELQLEDAAVEHLELSLGHRLASEAIRRYRDSHRSGMLTATETCFAELTQGAYPSLTTQIDKDDEILLAVDRDGVSKRAAEMSKGTRFQLYLALRAAAHEQLVAQGTILPFFCDDIFETFDEARTSAACRVMERIGGRGQAIYLTHHRHVVEIAESVCIVTPKIHEL